MPRIPNKVPTLKQLERYQQRAQARETTAQSLNAKVRQSFKMSRPPTVEAQTRGGLAGSLLSRNRPLGARSASIRSNPNVGRPSPGSPRIPLPPGLGTPRGAGAAALAYLAGAVWLHNLREFQKLARLSQAEPVFIPNPAPPFEGGQSPGVVYTVEAIRVNPDGSTDPPVVTTVYGPVRGGENVFLTDPNDPTYRIWRFFINAHDSDGKPKRFQVFGVGGAGGGAWEYFGYITRALRADGLADAGGNPPASASSGVPEGKSVPGTTSQIGTGSVPRNGLTPALPGQPIKKHIAYADPSTGWAPYRVKEPSRINTPIQPNEQNKRKPTTIQVPADNPITIKTPNRTVTFEPSYSFDQEIIIPPFPLKHDERDRVDKNREKAPAITGTQIRIQSPTSKPIELVTPGAGPIEISLPGYEPIIVDPTSSSKPSGLTPTETKRNFAPTPLTPSTPSLPTISQSAPITTNDLINYLSIALANSIPLQNTTKKTTKEAVCEEAKSNGCIGSPLSNLGDLLGEIGSFLGSNLPYLANGNDQANGALDEILVRLDELEQKLNEQQEPTQPEINLDEILQKLNRLSEVVGVDEYPASLPPTLISTDEPVAENISIANLTQLFGWYIQRSDEILGQWEIPIEIKDSDPTTPGDQPTKIKLPNLAEAVAEIYLLLFQNSIDSQTLVNIATRTMLETGQDKQQNYISYRLLQSLVDWAGYKVREDKEELPMLFNPGKTRFDELLVETKVTVPVVEFDEKHSLEADLMRFRKAASILDSVFYRKVNPFGDIKEQLMKNLKDKLSLAERINGNDDEAFERFINDAEIGFGNQPGIDNPNNPYGRPYDQRPRIRDLTNYSPPQ